MTRLAAQTIQAPQAAPSLGNGVLQRQCECGQHTGSGECEGCAKTKQTLRRAALSSGNPNSLEVPSIVHDVLRSPGQPLDQPTQAFFSPRFAHDFSGIRTHVPRPALNMSGMTVSSPEDVSEREADEVAERVLRRTEPSCRGGTPWPPPDVDGRGVATECHPYNDEDGAGRDLSNVRVHTDARAAESAREVNARAYTVGRDVVFGQGEYRPHSSEGRRLLAHELAHVFQQSPTTQIQREVFERNFPGGGHVDEEGTGLHRIWNFDVGIAELKPEHLEGIKKLAQQIKDSLSSTDPEEQVDLEGQASSTGTAKSNEALASRRAEAVKQALMKEGVAESKIRVTVVGEAKSEVGTTQENFARSRAVRVLFVPRTKLTGSTTPPKQTGCQPGINGRDIRLDIVAGAPVGLAQEGQFIVLRDGTTTSPGVVITAQSAMTPAKCGEFSFVQNVLTFRQIIYKDGSRNTLDSKDFVLDAGDPYPCQPFMMFFTATDGPGFGVNAKQQPRISTIEVREDFRTFLMFKPKDGTRRTHQVAEWRWAGQARNNDPQQDKGSLVLDTNISRMTPQAGSGLFTSTAPALSPNVADLLFVTDTSANPSPDSDAAKLVGGLNAARPKPKTGTPCSFKSPSTEPSPSSPSPAPAPSTKEKITGESG